MSKMKVKALIVMTGIVTERDGVDVSCGFCATRLIHIESINHMAEGAMTVLRNEGVFDLFRPASVPDLVIDEYEIIKPGQTTKIDKTLVWFIETATQVESPRMDALPPPSNPSP